MKRYYIFELNYKYLILIAFCITFLYITQKKENIKKETIFCNNKLDPFYVFKIILNSKPIILCKSKDAEHICYRNHFSFFQMKKGVVCFMNNFYINPRFWKEDGYTYNGPINKKTRGFPLISHGFLNMKCDLINSFSGYNKIYNSYFNSWNYFN